MNRSKAKLLICFALVAIQAGRVESANADGSRPSWEYVESKISDYAIVGFGWVDQPVGGVVLIRLPERLCAVRFLKFNRGRDERKPTSFHSGDESSYAEIELVELPRSPEKGDFSSLAVKRVALSWKPIVGVGHFLAFQRGEPRFLCGKTYIPWSYPTAIRLASRRPNDILGLEVAPTAWASFSDIDLNNQKLRWFKYDEDRTDILEIHKSELPSTEEK